ncbi:MAG: mechanosensitive ion channel family protein [Thermoguttaceae bacterium]
MTYMSYGTRSPLAYASRSGSSRKRRKKALDSRGGFRYASAMPYIRNLLILFVSSTLIGGAGLAVVPRTEDDKPAANDVHPVLIDAVSPVAPLITTQPPAPVPPLVVPETLSQPESIIPATTASPPPAKSQAMLSIPGMPTQTQSAPTVAPQTPAATVPTDTEFEKLIRLTDVRSPQAWTQFFLNAYQERDYRTAEWCVDFEGTRYQTASLRRDCLYRLDYVLLRLADTKHVTFPDNDKECVVRFRTKENFVDLTFVRQQHGHWQLSGTSVGQIDQLYHALYGKPPIRIHWVIQYLPEWMFRMYFGLTWFQWLFMIGGLFGGVVVYWIVLGIFHFVARAWMHVIYHREMTLSRKAWTPLAIMAMVTTWYGFCRGFNGLPPAVTDTIHYTTTTIVVAMTVLMMLRVVDLVSALVRKRGLGHNPSIDAVIVPLFSRSAKILVIFTGLLIVAQTYRWEVLPLLSGMGIGGIAVAFAAKETLANLFGSLTVLIDRPFIVGDWIITGNVEGTVEAVGMRSTRIRTFYNSLVTIPNNNLTTATIDNMGSRHFRRYKTLLNIQYDTPPDRIEAFCEGIRELVRRHPYTRKDVFHVYLHEFSSASLDILLNVFFVCPDTSIEYRERGNLISDILHLANDLDVRFAFPTQTVHLVNESDRQYVALKGDPITVGRAAAAKWRPLDDE